MTPAKIRLGFTVLSCCIGTAEGCLTAILAISAALVGQRLFSLAAGSMFCAYVVGSLLAPLLTAKLGLVTSIRLGLVAITLYAAAFLSRSLVALVLTAILNGLAAASMWTAQGIYMTRAAALIAGEATENGGVREEDVLKKLSGVFAVVFPLALTICKLSSSLILHQWGIEVGTSLVYAVYLGLSFASLLASLCVPTLPATKPEPRTYRTIELALATVQLLGDPTMIFMAPTNLAFGFVTAFFPGVVTQIVGDAHGEQSIGLLYALTGLSGALWSIGCAWLTTKLRAGVTLVMIAGAVCFASTCGLSFSKFFTEWPVLLLVFFLYGGGQAVWQGPTMALFGAYWPCNPQAAYANLKLHSGFASAIAFFVFPHLDTVVSAGCCLVTVGVGLLGYSFAACETAGYDRRRCCHAVPGCICKDVHKKNVVICSECGNPTTTHAFLQRAQTTALVLRREEVAYYTRTPDGIVQRAHRVSGLRRLISE